MNVGLTVNSAMNVVIWSGYVAVAVAVQFIRFPLRWWRAISVSISIFFFGCSLTHADGFLHATTHTPETVGMMGDAFHLVHLAVQAVTVWPAVLGLLALRRWVDGLLAKIATLEVLVEEAKHRRDVGSEWGARPS